MFEDLLKDITSQPPRPLKQLPGLRYGAAVPRQLIILLLFFGVFFLLVPLSIMRSDPKLRLATGQAATAPAQVIAVADADDDRSRGRRITYEFTPPQGVPHRGSAVAGRNSPYYSIKEGEALPVRYLPSDPGVNAIGDGGKDQPPLFFFAIFPLFFLVMFGAVFMPQLREVRRARKAFRQGRLVRGSVVYVRKRQSGNWSNQLSTASYDVFVAYQAEGRASEGRAWCNNEWLLHHLAPGTEVHLAYLPDRPEQIVLLDAFLR